LNMQTLGFIAKTLRFARTLGFHGLPVVAVRRTRLTVTSVDSQVRAGDSCPVTESEDVAFIRADVERVCGELVGLAPAIRLRRLAELRVMVEQVVSEASAAAMADAREEGWGLRRIGQHVGLSHEQVRRLLSGRSQSADKNRMVSPAPGDLGR
jgi:hypothetical protein